jgi:hypothetical protein
MGGIKVRVTTTIGRIIKAYTRFHQLVELVFFFVFRRVIG